MKRLTPVIVTWLDAHESTEDFDLAELFADGHENHVPAVTHTLGFFVKRDALGISITTELDAEGGCRTVNFIPAGMIVKVTRLRAS